MNKQPIMPCKKSSRKKYTSRNSPPYPANDDHCRGKKKKGNDGTYYVSTANSRGVYRWVKVSSSSKRAKSPRKTKKATKATEIPLKVTGWYDDLLDDFDRFDKKWTRAEEKIKVIGTYLRGSSGNNGALYYYSVPWGKGAEFKRVAKKAFGDIGLKVTFSESLYGLDIS